MVTFFLGVTQHALDDFLWALQSSRYYLEKGIKRFGEENPDTAEDYFSLGVTQYGLGDFLSALQSK